MEGSAAACYAEWRVENLIIIVVRSSVGQSCDVGSARTNEHCFEARKREQGLACNDDGAEADLIKQEWGYLRIPDVPSYAYVRWVAIASVMRHFPRLPLLMPLCAQRHPLQWRLRV